VAGGFLAARSLAARAEAGRFDLPALLWRRYLRLARPYWAALGSRQTRRASWMVLLAAVVGAALALEWRSRILVAGLTALALAADRAPQWLAAGWIASLSRISYAVFLIHYPVCLAVGAVVHRLWPGEAGWNAAGMVVAWLLSLGAGAGLHRAVERV
jgi:peptidoglycan/LPS O-acetylase OafA/YrhL